jgi:hypothetical protein
MWLDNFTSAPWVLVFDVDAIPVVPFRCHQLFDTHGRARWHSWLWQHASPWSLPCTRVFYLARLHGATYRARLSTLTRGNRSRHAAEIAEAECVHSGSAHRCARSLLFPSLDLMTTFPIIVPRGVLPTTRRLVTLAMGASCFDEAFVRLGWPSHGDLIGKTSLLLFPHLIHLAHCPGAGQRGRVHRPDELLGASAIFECETLIANTEHVRHPIQGSQSRHMATYLTPTVAARRFHQLVDEVHAYLNGSRPRLPAALFQYAHLDAMTRANASRAMLEPDAPNAVCGRSMIASHDVASHDDTAAYHSGDLHYRRMGTSSRNEASRPAGS